MRKIKADTFIHFQLMKNSLSVSNEALNFFFHLSRIIIGGHRSGQPPVVTPLLSTFSYINDAILKVRLHYMLINTLFLVVRFLSGLLSISVSVAGDSQRLGCLRAATV